MHQQGQIFQLGPDRLSGERLWAFRYRLGGRDAQRVQRGGFQTEHDARVALDLALERVRRLQHRPRSLTLRELVDEYLDQHQAEPETTEKLRWLLAKATKRFGSLELHELESRQIAAWRMTLAEGHRFEATQALRQVLARAIEWELLDINVAKVGVDNPVPTRKEMHPFDSWTEINLIANTIDPRYRSLVLFAAATGLRPGEWIALRHRDIDLDTATVHVERSYRNGRTKTPKTLRSRRSVPMQQIAVDAILDLPIRKPGALVFPAPEGGHIDQRNFRDRQWHPAQEHVGIDPLRRVYDLRHTFATFALRAGLSIFDLSRHMGTSLTMIDRHYGHLARDSHQHAITLLDQHHAAVDAGGRSVDTRTTSRNRSGNAETRR